MKKVGAMAKKRTRESDGKGGQKKVKWKSTSKSSDDSSSKSEEGPIKRFQGATMGRKKGEGGRSSGLTVGKQRKMLNGGKKVATLGKMLVNK